MTNQFILTADPQFLTLALDELSQVLPTIRTHRELAPGVCWVESDESFWTVAEQWRQSPPIFVRHICPVEYRLSLSIQNKVASILAHIETSVIDEIVPMIEPELTFSVQTRLLSKTPYKPFDINNAISNAIQTKTGAKLDVRAPHQVLSVVCTSDPHDPQTVHVYVGFSLAIHNLSDWAGGVRRFAREKEQVSRSEFKLLEALEVFGIELPAYGVALDLGASPGGWTRVLRQREQYVTAIDPGELDPRIAADRDVRHKHMTAELYLRSDPDQFDMIVNDMRMDARDSARLMVRYAWQLYPHGIVLMTLKLPEQGRTTVLDHAFNILEQAYTVAGARQLFHNRSEITVYLKRNYVAENVAM